MHVNNMFVKKDVSSNTRESSQIINILGEIPSGQFALAGFKPRIRVSISALVIGIWRVFHQLSRKRWAKHYYLLQ